MSRHDLHARKRALFACMVSHLLNYSGDLRFHCNSKCVDVCCVVGTSFKVVVGIVFREGRCVVLKHSVPIWHDQIHFCFVALLPARTPPFKWSTRLHGVPNSSRGRSVMQPLFYDIISVFLRSFLHVGGSVLVACCVGFLPRTLATSYCLSAI